MTSQEEKLDTQTGNLFRALAPDDVRAGRMVTISVNKSTGDRLLCQVIWEVAIVSDGAVVLECRHLRHLLRGLPTTQRVVLSDHDFYAADDLVAAQSSKRSRS